jgi:hypothetical protein
MTPERVRELMGWPPEAPDALLEAHLDLAGRTSAARVPAAARAARTGAMRWPGRRRARRCRCCMPSPSRARPRWDGWRGRWSGAFLRPAETEALQKQCAAQVEACIARILGAPAEAEKGGFWAAI